MSLYTLKVQTLSNGIFRLGLSTRDFNIVIPTLKRRIVFVSLPTIPHKIEVTTKTFVNHHNLFNILISDWIIENKYNEYPTGKPIKLEFELIDTTFYFKRKL